MAKGFACSQMVLLSLVKSAPPTPRVLVSQMVLLALVNSNAPAALTARGVNTGTAVQLPYPIHLDRKCRLAGVYTGGNNRTTWTLPIADSSLLTVVLASTAFGAANGTVLDAANGTIVHYSAGTIWVTGDYSAGPCIVGRGYTMTVELSRPYRRKYDGTAIIGDRIQIGVFYTAHRNTGSYTVRFALPSPPTRSDRTKSFAAALGTTEEAGEMRTLFPGWAEQLTISILNSTPRPSTISAVSFEGELSEGHG